MAETKKSKKSLEINSDTPKKKNKKPIYKNKYLLVAVLVLLVGVVTYFGRSLFVAALVNGTPITRLEVISQLESQAGAQTLEQLVTEVLIEQEAKEQNISVSGEEIQSELDSLRSELEAQNQNLDDLLTLQGITQDELKKQFRLQLLVEKMFSDKVEVTDEEIDKYIENLGESAPDMSEDELRSQARQQLEQQEMVSAFQSWLQQAKSEANINYFVNY